MTMPSEPFSISKRECDAVAERVEEVVLAVAAFVADAKALDLLDEVVSGMPFVDHCLQEGAVGVLYFTLPW
jgi:hypothetical protein